MMDDLMSPTEVVDQLRRRLQILAANSTEQVGHLQATGGASVDELALDLDDALSLAWIPIRASVVTTDQLAGARHVDELLDSFSGRQNADLWTYEALASAEVWARVRAAAREALRTLPLDN
jgi:hypothetical protein